MQSSLLSHDLLTSIYVQESNWHYRMTGVDWLLLSYGPLIDWLTDSIIHGLPNWLNDWWLIDWLTNWHYCLETYRMIEWFLANWIVQGHCSGPDQLTEWFMADWIVRRLTIWLNDLQLIEFFRDWPTDWMIFCWLIDWVTGSTIWGLANWLNDFWLIFWLTNWLYCTGTSQLTEWFLADWLTD